MAGRRASIVAEIEKGLGETVSLFSSLSPDELRGGCISASGRLHCVTQAHSGGNV